MPAHRPRPSAVLSHRPRDPTGSRHCGCRPPLQAWSGALGVLTHLLVSGWSRSHCCGAVSGGETRAVGAEPSSSRRCPSTAKKEDIKQSVRKLLNRHNIVFGDYTWTEFDEPFLTRNVQSVAIVDTELKAKDPQVPGAPCGGLLAGCIRGVRGLDLGLLGALGPHAGSRLHLRERAEAKTHLGRAPAASLVCGRKLAGSSDEHRLWERPGAASRCAPGQGARSTVGAQTEAEASCRQWGGGLCCREPPARSLFLRSATVWRALGV